MSKIRKYTAKSVSNENSHQKGSQENPFSLDEFNSFPEGEFPGGFVDGMGYVVGDTIIYGSLYLSDFGFSSFEDSYGSSPINPFDVDKENEEDTSNESPSNENNNSNGNTTIETWEEGNNTYGGTGGINNVILSSKSRALNRIASFKNTNYAYVAYPYISQHNYADALKRHIEDPTLIYQGKNGTCGAAVICKFLAEYRPEEYVEAAISLYLKGKYEKWEWTVSNESIFGTDRQVKELETTSVDIIVQGAIIHSNNIIQDYNPFTDGSGFSSFAWPGLFESFFTKIDVTPQKVVFADYEELEKIDFNRFFVIAAINIEVIEGYKCEFKRFFDYPNHYVQILGCSNGYVLIWQWGSSNYYSINGDTFWIYIIPK